MPVHDLVPYPQRVLTQEGSLTLDATSSVYSDSGSVATLLRDLLGPATGLPLKAAEAPQSATIVLSLDPGSTIGHEAYRLDVTPRQARIQAASEQGLIWGVQTLRQLLPAEVFSAELVTNTAWDVPAVAIDDGPRFGWRGALLDVGRWYKPVEFLYRYVDLAAMHKLNVVHLHLTDDQGWRFEVKRYPKLTEIGAWRRESQVGPWRHGQPDGTAHGGFYTQEQLHSVVAYAAARGITIVPEIDSPGHMQAAIASYPQLGNTPETQFEVATEWGIITHVLNVEDSTIDFLCNVLDEVLAVFPGQFIHIGGDECPKDEWKASARAQTLMRERGLADEDELQSWFIRQVNTYLQAKGRRLVGWDEILDGGIAPGATVMSWRGEIGGIRAAKAGHDVVMAPSTHLYFDYDQSETVGSDLVAEDTRTPLSKVFAYEPLPDALAGEDRHHVLGAQCALWCEYLPGAKDVEYMAFPRWCAFADVAWGRHGTNYAAFLTRLRHHLRRLDVLHVNYRHLD